MHIVTLSPQFVFIGSGLRFLLPCSEFSLLFNCSSSSSGSGNISNSSNFYRIDITNISMPVLVN